MSLELLMKALRLVLAAAVLGAGLLSSVANGQPGSVRDSAEQTARSRLENAALLKYAPVFRFHYGEAAYPVTIEYLLQGCRLLDPAGNEVKVRPLTPQDLAEISTSTATDEYRLEISSDVFGGLRPDGNNVVPAPIYASVVYREGTDAYVELNYFLLFAKHAAQVLRVIQRGNDPFHVVPGVGRSFNAIVGTYGEHQGDIERVAVRVKPDFTDIVDGPQAVAFEHHGDVSWWPKDQVMYEQATHPVAYVARNTHAMYNAGATLGSSTTDKSFAGREPDSEWYYQLGGDPNFLLAIDLVSGKDPRSPVWMPWAVQGGIVRIGIVTHPNGTNTPYHDQAWVLFRGRFGIRQTNSLQWATYTDNSNLRDDDWAWARTLDLVANQLEDVKKYMTGDGATGFGNCRRPVCNTPQQA